jgi:prephenate dehydrogenase
MDRITVIGMGVAGTSLGLALQEMQLKKTEVVGYTPSKDISNSLKKLAAFDLVEQNFQQAVSGAQLIIIDASIEDTRNYLQSIGPYLSDGAVVTDLGNSKKICSTWASEYLPNNTHYIAGRPIFKKNPSSIEDASADLFKNVYYCIATTGNPDDNSVKTLTGLAEAIGSKPYYLDMDEHDSYSAAMEQLPVIVSAAFVNATTGSDSWKEMHKTAGATFNSQSSMVNQDPIDVETQTLTLSEPLVHWIDRMIMSLHKIRQELEAGSDELLESFINAWEQRARWETNSVQTESNQVDMPSAGMSMTSAFLGDKLAQRLTRMGDEDKKSSWKYPRDR